MNTYTKHGCDLETQVTLEEAQQYVSTYAIPWLWGGDFNRTPDELLAKGLYLSAYAHVPKDTTSTCMVGGRVIDYFLTPASEVGSVQACVKITQTRIRPHDPVKITVDRRPRLTKVLAPVQARKWPIKVDVGPLFPKPTWEEAQAKLDEWGWKYPKFSTMNPTQELYLQEIGVMRTAVELGNKYCEWAATVTVQNITPHYSQDKDIKSHLGM